MVHKRYRLMVRHSEHVPAPGKEVFAVDELAKMSPELHAVRVLDEPYAWCVLDAFKSFSPVPEETVLRVCGLS